MTIETLEDWNQIIGQCCCEMPSCPVPTIECESINGTGQPGFVIYNTFTETYYGTRRADYSDGGFTQSNAPSTHWTWLGGEWIVPYQEDFTEGDPKTGYITVTYSNIVDIDASRDSSIAAMVGALDWETMDKGESCSTSRAHVDPGGVVGTAHLTATFARVRFVIPDTFTGSYFKVTWDVVEEPDGWDDEAPTASRSFFLEDQTWTWTGPGDPEDPDSWKSAWINLPPPATPGTRRVVNIRFECYRSTQFGNKPQVTGEAVTLPDA